MEAAKQSYVSRPAPIQTVRLRIHHKGDLITHPITLYVGETLTEMDWDWDVDYLSYMEVEKMIKDVGYTNVKGFKVVDIYVEHDVDIPDVIESDEEADMNEAADLNMESEAVNVNVESEAANVNVESGAANLNVESETANLNEESEAANVNVESEDATNDVNGADVNLNEDATTDVNGADVNLNEDATTDVNGADVNVENEGDDSETDPDYEESAEVDDESDTYDGESEEVDDESEEGDDESVMDWATIFPNAQCGESSSKHVIPDEDDCDSDELHTPPESDVEDEMPKFPVFKDTTKFELGMKFKDKLQIRDAMKEYAMEQKKNAVITKNDKKRVVVRCMDGCPFYIRFSMRTGNIFWQLISLTETHSFQRTPKNRQATTEWLGRKFMYMLRHSPEMRCKGLIAEALQKWGVKLSKDQAYRAKRKALELIQGAGREQFSHLRTYANELLKSNPNSTVKIQCSDSNGGPTFERIYVCMEACKAAFVTTCRPSIGLDACFLKGDFGGQLIAVVGKDGNNKIMPIAYAVVEAETKDSWKWFLHLLLDDLQQIQDKAYGFISDQQKGLVPAILETSQNVEHRLCVKHLYGNWRKKYPGIELKEALWRAARATTLPGWERAMIHMKELNPKAWKDMMAVPACNTRAHFKLDTQCDLQVNNMCEAFNRAILEYRDKPIITLLEGIKHYLTMRIATQKDALSKCKGIISPNIQKVLEKSKREAGGWSATWHSDDDFAIFGVSNGIDAYVVNLLQKKCSCRKWELTGITCCHAIACIWYNKKAPEDYVSSYYRRSTVLATYSHIILPTNGPQLWPISGDTAINPPVMRRAIGRPKKNRNKANDEPRSTNTLPRTLQTVKCKKCGNMGHNKRTCKGKRAADRSIPKGGNKKAKKKETKNVEQTVIEGGSQAPRPTQE
ncbi:uncharacterized protein LOC131625861 [Vicia villosa]|uniref:uncharacterized protein LOC131625861 n=1 Tax=Vicia villosa TaxID=3911 RepID=UPI00273BA6F1|nr:uncharacterized protein LOC131625861 [Vicia villosa]